MKACNKLKMTESEAWAKVDLQLIAHLNNNKKNRRKQVHSYYCMECKAWHTTTVPEKIINHI